MPRDPADTVPGVEPPPAPSPGRLRRRLESLGGDAAGRRALPPRWSPGLRTAIPEVPLRTTSEPDGDRRAAIGQVEAQVDVLARRIKRALVVRAAEVGDGLSPAGYLTLRHLAVSGPVRQVDLVVTFASEKGAVSRLVQHLVDAGLAERSPDPDDGRAQRVAATDRAQRILAEIDDRRRVEYRARLDPLDTAELEQLALLLGRYNAALEPPATDDR